MNMFVDKIMLIELFGLYVFTFFYFCKAAHPFEFVHQLGTHRDPHFTSDFHQIKERIFKRKDEFFISLLICKTNVNKRIKNVNLLSV